jgi:hypothetical protein
MAEFIIPQTAALTGHLTNIIDLFASGKSQKENPVDLSIVNGSPSQRCLTEYVGLCHWHDAGKGTLFDLE